MWTSKDYEDAAQKLGTDYMQSNGATTINDLATKVAEAAQLSPEGIRTLVRLANVSVFEHCFQKRAEDKLPDREVEYEVGDPEVVINRLYSNTKTACLNTMVPNTYNRATDLFGDFVKEATHIKTATATEYHPEEGIEIPAVHPFDIKMLFKRAEDRMTQNLRQNKVRWEEVTTKIARSLIAKDSSVSHRVEFEKDALAILGEEVIPELIQVHSLTNGTGTKITLFGGEKLASVQDTHVATRYREKDSIITMLKEAAAARNDYVKLQHELSWVTDMSSRIGA